MTCPANINTKIAIINSYFYVSPSTPLIADDPVPPTTVEPGLVTTDVVELSELAVVAVCGASADVAATGVENDIVALATRKDADAYTESVAYTENSVVVVM
jgi:hypothetical protein